MELSDHSARRVRFPSSLDETGETAMDYEEERKSPAPSARIETKPMRRAALELSARYASRQG